MTSTRPYLIRAFYDWIVDNDCTPHIVVNAEFLGTEVPREYIDSGQIVLNIAMSAVQALELSNETISFQARFGGIARSVNIPTNAVMAIYAKENGRGMVFTEEDNNDNEEPPPPTTKINIKDSGASKGKKSERSNSNRSHLTVIK